jgi:hypothetical protein
MRRNFLKNWQLFDFSKIFNDYVGAEEKSLCSQISATNPLSTMAQQHLVGQGLLTVEFSPSHSDTPSNYLTFTKHIAVIQTSYFVCKF